MVATGQTVKITRIVGTQFYVEADQFNSIFRSTISNYQTSIQMNFIPMLADVA